MNHCFLITRDAYGRRGAGFGTDQGSFGSQKSSLFTTELGKPFLKSFCNERWQKFVDASGVYSGSLGCGGEVGRRTRFDKVGHTLSRGIVSLTGIVIETLFNLFLKPHHLQWVVTFGGNIFG